MWTGLAAERPDAGTGERLLPVGSEPSRGTEDVDKGGEER